MSLGSVVSVNSKGSLYIGVISERIYPGGATLVGILENRMAVKITGSKVVELKKSVTVPLNEYTPLKVNQVKKTGTYLIYTHGVPRLAAIVRQKDMIKLAGKKSTLFADRGLKEYICILSDTEYLSGSTLKELQHKIMEDKLCVTYIEYTPHYDVVLHNMVKGIQNSV